MSSRQVALTAAFLALAAGGTAACDNTGDDDLAGSSYEWESDGHNAGPGSGSGSSGTDPVASEPDEEEAEEEAAEDEELAADEVFYCADEDGEVVEEEYCADDGGSSSYFLWHSSSYAHGLRPGESLEGGDYFPAGDRAARRAFKLPATGTVGNGTIKTSVVGRSSGGSGIGSGTSGG